MKNSPDWAKNRHAKPVSTPQLLHRLPWHIHSLFYLVALLSLLLLARCNRTEMAPQPEAHPISDQKANREFRTYYQGLGKQTVWELQQARAATAQYRNIQKAIADGYEDIHVVKPNMGHHYMKSKWVDATFDIRKPELLVYAQGADGSFELVAVEYAVPLALSPDAAPDGFTGSRDVRERNTGFGLWLLHAA
jgi:hypothetical protein